MGTTTNLGITTPDPASSGKTTALSGAIDALDKAGQSTLSIAITTDYTLTAGDYTGNVRFVLTGTPAAFDFNLPATSRFFLLTNSTSNSATVQVTGGAGDSVVVPAGSRRILYCDGADVFDFGGLFDSTVTPLGIKTEAATSRSNVLSDQGAYIRFTSASPTTFTVEPDSTVDMPLGSTITIEAEGSGGLTVAAGAGVTIDAASLLVLRAQYSVATLIKKAANRWTAAGDFNLS